MIDSIEQHKNPSAFRIPARNQTPPLIGTKIGMQADAAYKLPI
jgi:hypothetical protein